MSDHSASTAESALFIEQPLDERLRVLIADDTASVRGILTTMLRESVDALPFMARNGYQVVREYRAKLPDLVFLDIDMPGVDGLTALEEIRRFDPQAYVVMVSAHSSLEKVQQAVALGASAFVVKPFSGRRIAEVLQKFERSTGRAGRVHAGGPG